MNFSTAMVEKYLQKQIPSFFFFKDKLKLEDISMQEFKDNKSEEREYWDLPKLSQFNMYIMKDERSHLSFEQTGYVAMLGLGQRR